MSDSVHNQFADIVAVAHDPTGPGYPAQGADQKAAQKIAGDGIMGQDIAGRGFAGQGDSDATAASVGQAAKDPSHRPNDAEPFQCVSEMFLFSLQPAY